MFPVGFGSNLGISSPITKDGKFAGFYDGFLGPRKFPVDTASFAVNIEFLKKVSVENCDSFGKLNNSLFSEFTIL
jgi:hypothetical protein